MLKNDTLQQKNDFFYECSKNPLSGQGKLILADNLSFTIFVLLQQNHDEVNPPKNETAATCQELDDAFYVLTSIEAMCAEITKEPAQQKHNPPFLFALFHDLISMVMICLYLCFEK